MEILKVLSASSWKDVVAMGVAWELRATLGQAKTSLLSSFLHTTRPPKVYKQNLMIEQNNI